MEIEKDILDKTTRCNKDFDCIKNNNICCTVTRNVDKEVIFVECGEKNSCNYRMNFGGSDICNCPTRKEIFKKYGL